MNSNETNQVLAQYQNAELATSECRPVDHAKLAEVTGGVGPVFDLSKVEGPSLPSWYLPVSPRMSITTIR